MVSNNSSGLLGTFPLNSHPISVLSLKISYLVIDDDSY
jgi:hypothetical protein